MSLITQCPACSTMFRVVPDQLRISEGWVRCGQCDEAFDANAHLRSLEEHSITPELVSSPERSVGYEPFTAEGPSEVAYEATMLAPMKVEPELAYAPQGHSLSTESLLQNSPQEIFAQKVPDIGAGSAAEGDWASTELASLTPQDLEVPERVQRPDSEKHTVPLQVVLPDGPAPSFMTSGPGVVQAARWPSKKSLLAMVILLALLLGVQVLLMERDRIATSSPALRPLLLAGCELLACKVSPMREIESIVIDSSAFTSVRPGIYLLQVSLKNGGVDDLATPALELTLTDNQDRPVLRRVLQAAQLSGKSVMVAGAELAATLPISVNTGAASEKIAGYKLLAFYP